jgi:beta-lactam-binding protein with PASTA domain
MTTAPRNSTVNVTMGTHVPVLSGQTQAGAGQILANSSLVLGRVITPNGAGGTVSSSDPPADTGVLFNSTVNITLSGDPSAQPPTGNVADSGTSQGVQSQTQDGVPQQPPQSTVPDVTQKEQKTAYITLEKAGFHSLRPHGNENGVVSSQNPIGNSAADPTLPVDLYFELPQITTPEVRDYGESAAISLLKEAGLRATISKRASWIPDSLNTVVSQDPLPGTMVDPHSSVQIVLGVYAVPTNARLIVIVVLVLAGVFGVIVTVVKIIRWLIPTRPQSRPPIIPDTAPTSPTQSHATHDPAIAVHCTFVPQTGSHRFSIHASGPSIRFSLTLRKRESTPKYSIATQPSVTRVR